MEFSKGPIRPVIDFDSRYKKSDKKITSYDPKVQWKSNIQVGT